MSAPDTNVEKQERKHRGSLWGMGGVVAVALLLLLGLMAYLSINGGVPAGAETQIDSRTGQEVATE